MPSRGVVYVIGDVLIDHSIRGTATHIAPDAPVPVLKKTGEQWAAGGMWNAANNVAAAGVRTVSFGVLGDGPHQAFDLKPRHARLSVDLKRKTQVKCRILGQYDQQMVRLDTPKDGEISESHAVHLLGMVNEAIRETDRPNVLLICDYGCGVVTRYLMEQLRSAFNDAIMVVDPYPTTDPTVYVGADWLTPNNFEADTMIHKLGFEKWEQLATEGTTENLVVTRGPEPIMVRRQDAKYRFSIPPRRLVDPCGAGDAFVAHFAAALASGRDADQSLVRAVHAGACAVSAKGVVVVGKEAVDASIQSLPDFAYKVDGWDDP